MTEMNGTFLVLFDLYNRIFRPYFAAVHRIIIAVMDAEP
jgi:hypothetical protein